MVKIDLTKCNNCRFRAEISNYGPVSGRIVVDKGVYLEDEKGDFIGFLSHDGEEIVSMSGRGITDLEIVPRDPETYKDWQVGDVIGNADGSSGMIIFRSGEFVVADIDGCRCRTCRELFDEGYCLMLTDIEEKIIEEKKKYEPQDGDICYAETRSGLQKFIIIYNHRDWSLEYGVKSGKWRLVEDSSWLYSTIRPATDEEKQRLFDAMANEGKRWNAEKKVVEDIPKPHEFRKGEPVLVRNGSFEKWCIAAYCKPEGTTNRVFVGEAEAFFVEVIPYNERTMHLLGTTEDYKEEQR